MKNIGGLILWQEKKTHTQSTNVRRKVREYLKDLAGIRESVNTGHTGSSQKFA